MKLSRGFKDLLQASHGAIVFRHGNNCDAMGIIGCTQVQRTSEENRRNCYDYTGNQATCRVEKKSS